MISWNPLLSQCSAPGHWNTQHQPDVILTFDLSAGLQSSMRRIWKRAAVWLVAISCLTSTTNQNASEPLTTSMIGYLNWINSIALKSFDGHQFHFISLIFDWNWVDLMEWMKVDGSDLRPAESVELNWWLKPSYWRFGDLWKCNE